MQKWQKHAMKQLLQKLGLNKISTEKAIISTQKEIISTEKEII